MWTVTPVTNADNTCTPEQTVPVTLGMNDTGAANIGTATVTLAHKSQGWRGYGLFLHGGVRVAGYHSRQCDVD